MPEATKQNKPKGDSRGEDLDGKSIDELLDSSKGMKLGQFLIHLSMCYISLAVTGHVVLSFFTGHSPAWKYTSEAFNNTKNTSSKTFAIGSDGFKDRCNLSRSHWTYVTHAKYSYVTEFDLICNKESFAALISDCYHIGSLAGALLNGILSDAYGRKFSIVISSLLLPIPTICSFFINSTWQLCLLNVVRGVASTGAYYNGYVYISELAPPSTRAISTNVYMLFNIFSYLLVNFLAYAAHNWRYMSVYMGVVIIPLWCFLFFIPESPRWLLTKGRKEEAEQVLGKMIDYSGGTKVSIRNKIDQKTETKSYSYLDLLKNPQCLRLTASLIAIWIVVPILYFSIAKESIGFGGNMYINYALACIADVPALIIATVLARTIGRKTVNITAFITTSVLVGCILIVPTTFAYRHTIAIVLTIGAKLAVVPAFVGIFLWTSELYPTVIRSQGMSVCTIAEKLGMICIPLLTDLLKGVSYNLPFILISVVGILAGLVGFTLPETKDRPMREKFEDLCLKKETKEKSADVVVGVNNLVIELDETV